MRRLFVAAMVLALSLPASAQDHPATAALAEARAALEAADFATVDQALDRAATSSMGHDELVEWLVLRALVAYADERLGALEESLAGLASVLPAGAPPPEGLPRPVRARLAELVAAGSAIGLRVEVARAEGADGGPRAAVVPTILSDPGHLVRRVVVHAQAGESAWVTLAPGEHLALAGPIERDVDVRYAIEVLGPGDAPIASLGTMEMPEETTLLGIPHDDTGLVVGLTAGGVALAALVVVVVLATTTDVFTGPTTTTVTPPVVAPLLRF